MRARGISLSQVLQLLFLGSKMCGMEFERGLWGVGRRHGTPNSCQYSAATGRPLCREWVLARASEISTDGATCSCLHYFVNFLPDEACLTTLLALSHRCKPPPLTPLHTPKRPSSLPSMRGHHGHNLLESAFCLACLCMLCCCVESYPSHIAVRVANIVLIGPGEGKDTIPNAILPWSRK